MRFVNPGLQVARIHSNCCLKVQPGAGHRWPDVHVQIGCLGLGLRLLVVFAAEIPEVAGVAKKGCKAAAGWPEGRTDQPQKVLRPRLCLRVAG